MKKSQKQNILEYLKQGFSITPLDALNMFGCFRLANVIYMLKNEGHDIQKTTINRGEKSFASYKIITKEENGQRVFI